MSERWDPKDQQQLPVSKLPSLIVIVPARNERTSLPITLPSWLNQDYPDSEIILMDDESNDNTADCANDVCGTKQSQNTGSQRYHSSAWLDLQTVDASAGCQCILWRAVKEKPL